MILTVLVILLILCCLAFYLKHWNNFQLFVREGVLGPKPTFPFGNVKDSILGRRNINYEIDDIYREFKGKTPLCGFFSMFSPYYLVTDADLIRQIFVTDFKKFRNNDFSVDPKKDPIVARNPFWLRDDAWKEKRSQINVTMTSHKLKLMYPLILEGTKNLVDFIKCEIERNPETAFDARNISARYTCDSISSCTFGMDAQSFESEKPFFFENGKKLLRGMAESLMSLYPTKMIPLDVENFFIKIAKDAIQLRKDSKITQEDFLSHTISLMERKGLTDIDAAALCVTMFIDGFETTSIVLHHAFYQLAKNKRVQEKLRSEINENLAENGSLSYEKLSELPYLDQVFYEVVRLNPPLLSSTRVASEDVEIEGYKGHKILLKKDSAIWVSIHSVHRDPDYFTNPDVFNPERFDPEFGGVKAFKDRGVLIPFGDGPRICLGMRFGYMQVKAALAEIVKTFDISADKSMPEELKLSTNEFANVMDHNLLLNFKLL